jgi:lipopolysaccharide transport system ATP-binding protein
MTDIAISVRNVSKCYHVFENQRARLRHALWPRSDQGRSDVWSLRDINFEVERGDSVAIIGRNGSGKSTLLEIITGTLTPTSGEARVQGRVAALLELGSGFNPEYTGRENVFLNGLLLGLTRTEVEQRYDDIVGFADIGDVLDRQVKTYSSGMLVRLAFAVQVALEPDILIVDEALSVGDYFFQQKCFGRLKKMRDDGLTLLFVSHDMGTVRDLCSTAVYLKQGRSQFVGDSKAAVRAYLAEQSPAKAATPETDAPPAATPDPTDRLELAEIKQTAIWSVADDQEAGRRLLAVRLLGADGQPTTHARIGDTVTIQVYFRTPPDESGHISFVIKNRFDQVVTSVGTYRMQMEACSSGDFAFATFEAEVNLRLEAGQYSLMVSYGQPIGANRGNSIDSTDWFGPLHINWDYEIETAPFLGMFGLPVVGRLIMGTQPTESKKV